MIRNRHFATFFMAICFAYFQPTGACRAESGTEPPAVRPEYHWSMDAPVLAGGAALLITGNLLSVNRKFVPEEGLDPNDIHWSIDRKVVGEHSTRADDNSDYFRNAALAYPVVLSMIYQPSGSRLSGTLWRVITYAEAFLMSRGLSSVIQKGVGRPRPFTYLSSSERPKNPTYDVTSDRAFESMPSGHSTTAFCAVNFAVVDHLISRPDAGWKERAGIGFIAGVLAGGAAALRVEGGQHFPSDTIVGGLIGTAGGVTAPLLHHYIGLDGRRAKSPPARAWWQALAGEIAGIGVGILVAEAH